MVTPAIHYTDDAVTLWHGDSLEVLRDLPDASVDAVVTDPPYGIRFMGQAWDGADIQRIQARNKASSPMPAGVGGPNGGYRSLAAEAGRYNTSATANRDFQEWVTAWAVECLRILKPGGHLLSSGSSRTWHRLAAGIEDAGFEIRDSIAWLYGSGFPKSLDVSKAIDKAAGHVGDVVGSETVDVGMQGGKMHTGRPRQLAQRDVHALSPEAAAWDGWGTALKPAFEPIVVARKPLTGTVAQNVLTHGTGALNIDGTRTTMSPRDRDEARVPMRGASPAKAGTPAARGAEYFQPAVGGRWPTNVAFDTTQAAELDLQAPDTGAQRPVRGVEPSSPTASIYGTRNRVQGPFYGDTGGASRFFPTFRYEAKAPADERPVVDGIAHPTVKPLDLMRWLVRLVTPPGGTVLEPFAGSGTTAEACVLEHMRCIAIEREATYLPLIVQRLTKPLEVGFDLEGLTA